MQSKKYEIADIIEHFGEKYRIQCKPNSFILRTLDALRKCRTSALGGHSYKCTCCGKTHISYNSCRNRHCPKCQSSKQALWVEDRVEDALDVKHFHIVFTIPDKLNDICLTDSKWFYNIMFECAWDTLRTIGYSHLGVECGAITVLHTWGQTLSFHPHIHCIVPAAGLTLKGKIMRITKNGRYLFPVKIISKTFRGKLMAKIKFQLKKNNKLDNYSKLLNTLWKTDWNVFCKPPLGNAKQIIKYLGKYTHRIAISNNRIKSITKDNVTFSYKDYADDSKNKLITLSGVEFLRRFAMHILPYRFVKIRYYGIYSSKMKSKLACKKKQIKLKETPLQRLLRITGIDVYKCPFCKKGQMVLIQVLPKIRSPTNPLYFSKTL